MAEFALTEDIPFGPFEGTPIQALAARGKNARLHASKTCSSLRTSDVQVLTVPLNAQAVRRMCQSCAQWGAWTRPHTALGVFLDAVTGLGLAYQLARYTPDDLADDLEGQDPARAAELLPKGEWPADEDDDKMMKAYEEARYLRDSLLLPFWRGAADSLHAALGVVGRYPWLHEWARPRLAVKSECVEELRCQLGSLITARNLLDAGAAYFLPEPELPVSRPEFAVFGKPPQIRATLEQAWRRWRADAAGSWLQLEHHEFGAYGVMAALGRKRKGRDEAERALRELYQGWASQARQAVDASPDTLHKFIVATVPEAERRSGGYRRDEVGFDRLLSSWQLGVLAVHTVAADWSHRVALLRVPEIIARRLLGESSDSGLRCVELAGAASAETSPAELLATWVRDHVRGQDSTLLPGVLDDGPVYDRRAVSAGDLAALRTAQSAMDQPYLVFSATHGVEVLPPDLLVTRCETGWTGVIIAGAADLPASLITDWQEEVAAAGDRRETDVQVQDPAGARRTPENVGLGAGLGMRAGERELAEREFRYGRDDRALDWHLRLLALARATTDLRLLGSRYSDDQQLIAPNVWHGLLAFSRLDLTPFRANEEGAAASRRRGGLGLPLSILSPVQLYTTDSNPDYYGKGHAPDCRHAHSGPISLDASYHLLTVADLISRDDYDWCGKCSGYAVRRLNEAQLGYYQAAHRLNKINDHLDRHRHNPRFLERERDSISAVLPELRKLAARKPGPDADEYERDSQRWHDIATAVEEKAKRLLATAEDPPDTTTAGNVVKLHSDSDRE